MLPPKLYIRQDVLNVDKTTESKNHYIFSKICNLSHNLSTNKMRKKITFRGEKVDNGREL